MMEGQQIKVAPQDAGPVDLSEARHTLSSVYGYGDFLPLQEEVITNVLKHRDTLVIMPTGGGKSLCYQLPSLLFDGLTVVVSPLIALMHDQVSQLRDLGVAAVYLNSSLDRETYSRTAWSIRAGEVKLLYVAPETLLREDILAMLDQCQVACLAVDEAHCISSWGHDFRPEYRGLAAVRDRYERAVCIALTATATPRVQNDIKSSLGFDEADTFVASFDRPNLLIGVRPRAQGLQQVLTFLEQHREQSGIIYCSTRRQVETLAADLNANGWAALPYHAGLDDGTRRRNQMSWVRDDMPIMVATVAFGMGIDKSNVRFIIHFNLPQNVESYYQQIGRAGRDGLPADCLLLYTRSDVHTIYRFIEDGAESEQAGRTARLQALVRFAESRDCRRRPLLAYFGEEFGTACRMCDNCLHEGEEDIRIDVTVAAQKFLSCVHRTGQRFGVAHIVDVLRGSQNKKVLANGHQQLSTHGIGMEYSAAQWKSLAQQFIGQDLMLQDMQHGGISLTAKAAAVFKGEQVFAILEVEEEKSASAAPRLEINHDPILFAKLRTVRKELADAADLPAYIVFSDRALVEMAAYFPRTEAQLLRINGVGAVKLEKYGSEFLTIISEYCEEHDIPISTDAQPATTTAAVRGMRRFEEVGQHFLDGRSVAELQTQYGVKRSTIVNHLANYQRAGGAVDGARLRPASQLDAAQQEEVLATFQELGHSQLKQVFEALTGQVSYDELHLMRVVFLSQSIT